MVTKTPICPGCGHKFPGDPCRYCGKPHAAAAKEKAGKMPSQSRRRRRHGRQ